MRILHAIATMATRYGGPSKACFEMARATARQGHTVTIFTTDLGDPDLPGDTGGAPVARDGVAIHRYPVRPPRFWGTSPGMARGLREAIPGADVVHLHSLYLFHDRVVGRECARSGVPYLVQPHGALDPWHYRHKRFRKWLVEFWFQDAVIRRAGVVQFATEEEMRLARPRIFGTRAVVVPLGIDPDEYALPPRGRFRAVHPRIGDRPVVVFLGRLDAKKGLDIVVRAFSDVIRGGRDAHLVIAGPDDGMRARIERWIDAHGLRERATLTGMVTGPDKLALLADADLFVLPSWSESFGIAVIEAMACGLPVAISDRVSVGRAVEAAGAGWVTPVAAGPLRDAIDEALGNPAEARERGERGRTLVAERYAWSRIAPAQEAVYGSLV